MGLVPKVITLIALVAAAQLSTGCGANSKDTSGSNEPVISNSDRTLCDGSDDVRFVLNTDGGMVDTAYSFFGAYGHRMLAIDGHCDYWVVTRAGAEVRHGHIANDRALEIETELSFGRLGEFDFSSESCDDGAPTTLWDPSGSTQCGCVCNEPSQPADWKRTIANARDLAEELYDIGQPMTEGLSILLQRSEAPQQDSLFWPLERVPEMLEPDFYDIQADSGILIESAEERRTLRALRTEWVEQDQYAYSVPMHGPVGDAGSGVSFTLYLRDEVPARVWQALQRARGY